MFYFFTNLKYFKLADKNNFNYNEYELYLNN